MELIATPPHDATSSIIDASHTMYPSRMTALRGATELANPTSSFFGYVVDGSARLETRTFDITGRAGTYFACPGPVQIQSDGLTIVIERLGYRCLPQAGSIEAEGRLSYIDGCSDTLLVSPARRGDAVLNLLHFPTGVRQSVHSHPSIRLGVVARGSGHAFGPGLDGAQWRLELRVGMMFMLPAHEMHAFSTAEHDSTLDIVAFHPDSDWGPTDSVHPMLNRTYLR